MSKISEKLDSNQGEKILLDGFLRVKDASVRSLHEFKDVETGEIFQNVFVPDKTSRYSTLKINEIDSDSINKSTSLGDLFASVVFLSNKIDYLLLEVDAIKRKQEVLQFKHSENYDEMEHMAQHVFALESNLRCLRETLTYGDFEEEDLPQMKECDLAEKLKVDNMEMNEKVTF